MEAGAGVDVIAARDGAADVVVVVASELMPDNGLSVLDVVVVLAIGLVLLVRVDVPRPPSEVAGLLSWLCVVDETVGFDNEPNRPPPVLLVAVVVEVGAPNRLLVVVVVVGFAAAVG